MTKEELDALPIGSVVSFFDFVGMEQIAYKYIEGYWTVTGYSGRWDTESILGGPILEYRSGGPITLLERKVAQ